jgi:hypothetical protein
LAAAGHVLFELDGFEIYNYGRKGEEGSRRESLKL